jgi:hypothetical protein
LRSIPPKAGFEDRFAEAEKKNLLPPTLSVALLKGAKLLVLYPFSISLILAIT